GRHRRGARGGRPRGRGDPRPGDTGLRRVADRHLGTPEQQKRLLSGVEDRRILTAAVAEPGAPLPPEPTVRREGGTLTGTVTAVRYAAQARSVVVPVSTSEGAALVVVAPDAPGVTLTPTLGSLGVPEYAVRFGATPVDDDDV